MLIGHGSVMELFQYLQTCVTGNHLVEEFIHCIPQIFPCALARVEKLPLFFRFGPNLFDGGRLLDFPELISGKIDAADMSAGQHIAHVLHQFITHFSGGV
ncbi:hypothetical protein IQ64_13905 [Streptomyces stelliscabiei]|nr:hypothetical protein IQ64_13905 [Streptomyces stelliscabiei]